MNDINHSAYDFPEIVKHARLIIDTRNTTRGVDEGLNSLRMDPGGRTERTLFDVCESQRRFKNL